MRGTHIFEITGEFTGKIHPNMFPVIPQIQTYVNTAKNFRHEVGICK